MNRMYISCGIFLLFLAAGGYGWGHAVGFPYIGMAVAGAGPLILLVGIWFAAFLQGVWLPAYPKCKNGTCIDTDGYAFKEFSEDSTTVECRCGDTYVCTRSRSNGAVLKRVMADGSPMPFKTHNRWGRWKNDDESLPVEKRPPFIVECMREFNWWLRRRRLRRQWLSAVSRLNVGKQFGDEIFVRITDDVSATLYLWVRRRKETEILLDTCIYFRVGEVEKTLFKTLAAPREAFSQIGTIGFDLDGLFGQSDDARWILVDRGNNQTVLDDFCTLLTERVVPFMKGLTSIEAFAKLLTDNTEDVISVPMSHYRVPVILYLAGDPDAAEKRIEKGLEETAEWNAYSKSLYASYAERFRDFVKKAQRPTTA